MRKNFLRILCGVICACLLCLTLVACGGAGWTASSLNDPGATDGADYARVGFIAETENYIYYLNGVATTTDDNAFGVPVKGALMAVSKGDLTSKTEVVVPKLFTSKNYEQGLFIFGGYVYYGTPSTNKTSSGAIATSDMVFTRSSLDGKATTEALYTVGSHSTDYRFVESDGVVYIVYYDTDDSAIVSVNTSTKEVKQIIKTDAKVEADPVNGEYGESLGAYKFVGDKVIYTVTVYTEIYNEEKLEENETSRETATYNKVYLFEAGKEAELLFDGRESGTSYEIKFVDKKTETVFVSETKNTLTKTYSYQLGETLVKGIEVNADYLSTTNVLVGNNVYTLTEGKVYFDSIEKDSVNKELVAKCETISSLLFEKDGYIYYLNSDNKICAIELNDVDAEEIVITENSVANTWYAPAIVTLANKDYLFYADSSAYGLNYVKYVEINVVEKDTDEDGIKDTKVNDSESQFLGKISAEDGASMFSAKVNNLSSKLEGGAIVFDTNDDGEYVLENGSLVWSALKDVRAEYETLSAEIKAKVESSVLETLKKYEKAVEKASIYNKLDGVWEHKQSGAEDQTKDAELRAIYNQVKDELTAFESSKEFNNIKGLINNNFKHLFQTAKELFETEE